jgi:hypothetical protein
MESTTNPKTENAVREEPKKKRTFGQMFMNFLMMGGFIVILILAVVVIILVEKFLS